MSKDWHQETIKTYDESASEWKDYFKGVGTRSKDIAIALKLVKKPATNRVRAVEIGCGNGRDAEEIIKHADWYEGFDPSKGLLELARKKLPRTSFVLADALSYEYPGNTDVVFAFASLLHVDKNDLPKVFKRVWESLRPEGIFYISLKESDRYTEEVDTNERGSRMFYFYNPELISKIAGGKFSIVYEGHQKIGETAWFTIALRKNEAKH